MRTEPARLSSWKQSPCRPPRPPLALLLPSLSDLPTSLFSWLLTFGLHTRPCRGPATPLLVPSSLQCLAIPWLDCHCCCDLLGDPDHSLQPLFPPDHSPDCFWVTPPESQIFYVSLVLRDLSHWMPFGADVGRNSVLWTGGIRITWGHLVDPSFLSPSPRTVEKNPVGAPRALDEYAVLQEDQRWGHAKETLALTFNLLTFWVNLLSSTSYPLSYPRDVLIHTFLGAR